MGADFVTQEAGILAGVLFFFIVVLGADNLLLRKKVFKVMEDGHEANKKIAAVIQESKQVMEGHSKELNDLKNVVTTAVMTRGQNS